jgi:bifunctional DNA-binding transcriptional regulator/antitoxin component of YhaV-PrlF toxin-antitoxin module
MMWWDDPTMIVKLDSKRRLTIPVDLAPARPGDYFEALYDEDEDKIVFRRVKRRKDNWLEVLKQCPVSMDDIPPRSRELSKKLRL